MNKICLFFAAVFLTFAQAINAQEGEVDLAKVYKNMGDYDKAISQYEKHHSELDEFQLYELAELHLVMGQNTEAILVLKELVKHYPDFQKAYLPLAGTLRKLGDYGQAMKYYEVYGNFDPYASSHYIESMRWAEETQLAGNVVSPRNGLNINTMNFESFPVAYKDKVVYASTRTDIKRNHVTDGKMTTQMFSSLSGKNQEMTFPAFLLKDLQAWSGMATIAMHPETNEVVFTKISQPNIFQVLNGEQKGMSLYIAELEDGELKHIKAMPFNSISYNTGGAVYSEDGNTVYFMSDMTGGYGGYDIYSSTRNSTDGWSEPINLGKEINSSGNEIFPAINDGKLVFASDWWPGYGGYDLFAATYNTVNSQWTNSVNMGYGINSQRDEFTISKIGTHYFLTAMNENSVSDIYNLGAVLWTTEAPALVSTSYTEKTLAPVEHYRNAFITKNTEAAEEKLLGVEMKESTYRTMDVSEWLSLEIQEALQQRDLNGPKKIYSIQVAIVEKTSSDQMQFYADRFSDIDEVYKIYFPNEVKIRVGSYASREAAASKLRIIHNRGYRDAFIVEEEIMYSSSANDNFVAETAKKTETVKESPSTTTQSTQAEVTKPVASKTISSMTQVNLVPLGDGNYKVRLAAYLEPKWFNADKAKALGNIQRVNKDQWAIYFVGDYRTIDESKYILNQAIEAGFNNAEIVEFRDGDYHKVK